jgi:hypothetical protein
MFDVLSLTAVRFTDEICHLASANVIAYDISSETAWERETPCPFCEAQPLVIVAQREEGNWWFYCLNCRRGSVANEDFFGRRVHPGRKTLPTPDHVPQAEQALWEEIRSCLSVSAHTAVAMLCRKMLLHLAHTHDVANKPNATPPTNFLAAVDYLKNNNLIPVQFHDWVDKVRKVGNEANHELPQITQQDAEDIALFTHQLLVTLYELPGRAKIPSPMGLQPPASPTTGGQPAQSGPTGINPNLGGMA